MLMTIQSLKCLSKKTGGAAGQPVMLRMGVQQGCLLSSMFGKFFDGLHDHLLAWLPLLACSSGQGGGCLRWRMLMMSYSNPGRLMRCSS